jgi:hypothetical protein
MNKRDKEIMKRLEALSARLHASLKDYDGSLKRDKIRRKLLDKIVTPDSKTADTE